MNRLELEKLSKSQLIELLLLKNKKEKSKSEKPKIILRPMPAPITKKPVIITKEKKKPAPIRKVIPKGPKISTIIQRPVPAPRTKKSKIIQRPVPAPRTKKSKIIQRPVPAPRTKKSYIFDEPIPEKEIPKGQKILKPRIIRRRRKKTGTTSTIRKVIPKGPRISQLLKKDEVNWEEWLKKEDVPEIDHELETFKKQILDLYKEVPIKFEMKQLNQAMQGYTQSHEIKILNNTDPLSQLQLTRNDLKSQISIILTSLKGLKFVESLKVTLSKTTDDGVTITNTVDFFSTTQTIINNTEIPASLEESQEKILNKIAIWISEGSGWTVVSVDKHYLNVVKYTPLEGSSYIKMPRVLRNRSLINIKNYDNECFRWCHIRHLNPQKKIHKELKNLIKHI